MPRLATWNLAVPASASRRDRIEPWLEQVAADVWVLTESHAELDRRFAHHHSSSPGRDGDEDVRSRWVTIGCASDIEALPVSDPVRSAAGRLELSGVGHCVVFGTVLPWLGSRWRDVEARDGNAFAAALEVQCADWVRLRARYPEDEFFLMGDFNQDLAETHYYGSRRNRAALGEALETAGLVAWTSGDFDPVRRGSPPSACIDHICGRSDSSWRVGATHRWPQTAKPDPSLSDHFGVAVDLVA